MPIGIAADHAAGFSHEGTIKQDTGESGLQLWKELSER
jgi:hypothetical protein